MSLFAIQKISCICVLFSFSLSSGGLLACYNVNMKLPTSFVLCATTFLIASTHALPSSYYEPPESAWSVCKSTSPYPDLLTASFEDISSGLEKGLFTAVELTATYIARIQETQSILRAIIEINPHALTEAAAADAARAAGNATSQSLLGIPIIVKDNIATARPE